MPGSQQQSQDAQALYDARSTHYERSWHPRFARHMVEIAKPQPGEKVLDLASGTGLVTFLVAQAVGRTGSVVGIDVSSGMLSQSRAKLERHDLGNVQLYQHSITDLDTLPALEGKEETFDLITCVSALVLLPEPGEAIQHWVPYLKPGGRLVVDVTHIQNQIAGITFERVGRILGRPVPWYRLNFQKPGDLQAVLEDAGLTRVELMAVSQIEVEDSDNLEDYLTSFEDPRCEQEFLIDDADAVFNHGVKGPIAQSLGAPAIKERAKAAFKTEWTKLADPDGLLREIDCVFVGVGWKP